MYVPDFIVLILDKGEKMHSRQFRFRSFFMLCGLFVAVQLVPTLVRATSTDASTLRAAEQGNADAQAKLGLMFKEGLVIPQDYQKALNWYTRAAEQNHPEAQLNLAVMYYEGQGTPQNYGLAYVWSSLAAVSGNARAVNNRDLLAAMLPPQELADAQAQAAALLEKIKSLDVQGGASTGAKATQTAATPQAPAYLGSGSGFVITPDGYILTCAHVVVKAGEIKVKLGERTLVAKTVRIDLDSDLALLKVYPEERIPSLAFSENRSATLGQEVFTIGYPNPALQGVAEKLTRGSVSSLAGAFDDPRYYQISVQVHPGNSGGPLLDGNGNVVGVVKSRLKDDVVLNKTGSLPQDINYAVKSTYALSMIDSMPEVAGALLAPDVSPRPFADVVLLAERGVVQILTYE